MGLLSLDAFSAKELTVQPGKSVVDAFWPDFGRELLEQAIDEFRRRIRRFGGVVARSTV